MKLSQIGEFGLIERLRTQLATRAGVQLGIGDDCAVLDSLQTPILTMDALVEGVHFRRDWTSPRALGRKAMAVNVSDLAASGARPVAALVSLALGPDDDVAWVEQLYAGFEDAAREFDFTLVGGDTVKSRGDLMMSVALVGEVLNPNRGPILRSGAQIGDVILVSGSLGDSAAGLALLQAPETPVSDAAREFLLLRHHEPTPRLEIMRALLEIDASAVHAALDLSDGLVGDGAHMAQSSDVSLHLDADLLPISSFGFEAALALEKSARDWALSGGEDYELLLALAPQRAQLLAKEVKKRCGVKLSPIGKCVAPDENRPRVVVRENGVEVPTTRAWTHF
ncbi:MAG TPA: thiamine-phosphate kinase [Abditibacterium sp.]|jgi:thiamine-monophosphate kinase